MSTIQDKVNITRKDIAAKTEVVKYPLFQRYARVWMCLILFISDTISLLLALLIAVNIHLRGLDLVDRFFYVNLVWIPILLLLIIFAENGLYPAIGVSAVEEVHRLSLSTSLLFLIIFSLTFLSKTADFYSRIVFLLAWVIALLLIPLNRNITRRLSVNFKIWGEQVAIAGFPNRKAEEVADFFVKFPHKGILPKVIYTEESNWEKRNTRYDTLSTQLIHECPHKYGIKTILVVVPNWNWVGENIDKYRYLFERVILIQNLHGNLSLSDSIVLDFNGVLGFQVKHNLLDPWSMFLKRLIDIFGSILLFLVLAPLMICIGLLILFETPGGIFYQQLRLGKGGKPFRALKFRTMYIDGDAVFQARLREDKAFRDEWQKYQKVKNDPRITRVGAVIRQFSLDELPQLWNIIKGEMSLVGPRPIMLNQQEMYGPGLRDYKQVRPGVTGLWQVSGRNRTTFARRAELDMEYIQRWSIWLDIYIVFQTVREVLSREGAY